VPPDGGATKRFRGARRAAEAESVASASQSVERWTARAGSIARVGVLLEEHMGQMAKRESLEAFARRRLVERQRSLVERRDAKQRDAQVLYEERETDWEDRASDIAQAENLDHLGDNELAQLRRVTSALGRLADGTWGRCVSCGGPIAEKRLRALPEAVRCARCTNHH
jgi:RNA polymerase-binding transcription factor DksA